MLFLEMKRRLNTKYVLFSMLGIFIITIGLNFMIVYDHKDIAFDLKEEAIYQGNIKEENLFLSLKKVRDENSEDKRYQSQVFVIDNLIRDYPGVLYKEIKIKDYPDKYATEFYDCWRNKFKFLIKKLPSSQQQNALKKLNEIKTPFAKYPGYYLYYTAFENIQLIFILILFLVTFFASETYSTSFEDGSIEIIKATKNYKKNMFIRILPVIFYGGLLTLIATLGTVGMISFTVGPKALKSSYKMISLFSFGNFSIGQAILVMMLAEILGIITLSTLMGYISLKTKKTTITIASGVSLSMFYMIVNKFMAPSMIFMKYILNAIPMASSHISISLSGFSLNFGIWEPYAIILEVLLVFILSTIMLTINIEKGGKLL